MATYNDAIKALQFIYLISLDKQQEQIKLKNSMINSYLML